MSRLNLLCGLCGRQQADGLLSRQSWGHLEVGPGNALRACPTCREQHRDWEERLLAGGSAAQLPPDARAYGIAG
jgi:hypothetical protein